jgi:hypothetical protein
MLCCALECAGTQRFSGLRGRRKRGENEAGLGQRLGQTSKSEGGPVAVIGAAFKGSHDLARIATKDEPRDAADRKLPDATVSRRGYLPLSSAIRKDETCLDLRLPSGRTGFSPPTGPDCCATCGFHTPTQGHRDGCAASA